MAGWRPAGRRDWSAPRGLLADGAGARWAGSPGRVVDARRAGVGWSTVKVALDVATGPGERGGDVLRVGGVGRETAAPGGGAAGAAVLWALWQTGGWEWGWGRRIQGKKRNYNFLHRENE
jgi:hypothetical protein